MLYLYIIFSSYYYSVTSFFISQCSDQNNLLLPVWLFPYKCYLNISAQTFTTSYWVAHYLKHRRLCRVKNMLAMYLKWYFRYIASIFLTLHKRLCLKVNNITAISYSFLTLIIHLYNNWLKLIFFFQIIIIIDLNYVSFSKLPFNNNETNFQIEQIVLLISLSIVLTLYIILELPLFDCIIIINSVVAVALYEERIGLSFYPILFSTFLNKIRLN
jgi:hypothetical protein